MAEDTPSPSTAVKVLLTGPHGVGKTTLIRTLSEINVVSTERSVATGPDGTASVPLDFGRRTIDSGLTVQLFATPGRDRFEDLDEILGGDLLGLILLVDESRPDSAEEAMRLLVACQAWAQVPFVVGVTHAEASEPQRAVQRARHALRLGPDARVEVVDARSEASAREILLELFYAAQDDADKHSAQPHAV